MLWIGEQRDDGRISQAGTQLEILILGVPTRDGGVMLRNRLQRVNARCPRRVGIQMIFEDLL